MEGSALKDIEKAGLQVLTEPNREAFGKIVSKQVAEEYAAKFGWDTINRINAALK